MSKVLLTGGGTLGSVVPLIALAESLGERGDFHWLGTADGPEKAVVVEAGFSFQAIAAGKLRRYFSWRNFSDPFFIIVGFFQALAFCIKWRPNLVVSAGAFVAVPVVWAAKLSGAKVLLYQLDKRPGLANQLCWPVADCVAAVWPATVKTLGSKAVLTPAIMRASLHQKASHITKSDLLARYHLQSDLPLVLVTGGGTGASGLNDLLASCLVDLATVANVIHSTGPNRSTRWLSASDTYFRADSFSQSEMAELLAASDLVVSRAGMGALSELAYHAKATVLVPLPHSHQEENASALTKEQAVVVVDQASGASRLVTTIKTLLADHEQATLLGAKLQKTLANPEAASLTSLALKLLHPFN
jgi:UDP-N-acetylglucosamine--N-acetylmuramyl-(pentapeptide) pyrophosphoryl-undecaprenol N-acetylglucosamine transferase